MSEKALQNLSVQRLKPAQLDIHDYYSLGLVDLVASGYGYSGTADCLLQQALQEYDGIDKEDRINIFLALSEGKAVGSLTTVDWSPGEPVRGSTFWSKLSQSEPGLYENALKNKPGAIEIIGIVTHPDFRNSKVATRLLRAAGTEMEPSFVFGQTKTPDAVMARAGALSGLGYRTFYGSFEVTPVKPGERFNPDALLKIHSEMKNHRRDGWGVHYVSTELLLPTVPDVSSYPGYVQRAFKGLVMGQNRVGSASTAVRTMLSVKKSLL